MHGNVKDNGRTDKVIRSETTIQMVRGEEMMVITAYSGKFDETRTRT